MKSDIAQDERGVEGQNGNVTMVTDVSWTAQLENIDTAPTEQDTGSFQPAEGPNPSQVDTTERQTAFVTDGTRRMSVRKGSAAQSGLQLFVDKFAWTYGCDGCGYDAEDKGSL